MKWKGKLLTKIIFWKKLKLKWDKVKKLIKFLLIVLLSGGEYLTIFLSSFKQFVEQNSYKQNRSNNKNPVNENLFFHHIARFDFTWT